MNNRNSDIKGFLSMAFMVTSMGLMLGVGFIMPGF